MKFYYKITSLCLSFVLLGTAMTLPVQAISKEDAEQQLENLDKEIGKYQDKLQSIQNDKSKQNERIKAFNEQIKIYDEQATILGMQIDDLNTEITTIDDQINSLADNIVAINEEIEKIDSEIAEQKQKIDETSEMLGKRLRASYMTGSTGYLELLLDADSVESFAVQAELLNRITKKDNKIIEDLKEQMGGLDTLVKNLNEKKAALEADKTAMSNKLQELNDSKASLESKKTVFDSNQAAAESKLMQMNELVEGLDRQSEQYKKLQREAEAEKEKISQGLDSWVSDNGSHGSGDINNSNTINHNFKVSSRGIISPMQEPTTYFSANYAQHIKNSIYGTKAVDMCGPMTRTINGKSYYTTKGAKLYAVASGTVIKSTYQAGGYGNYVIIDHGNGLSSLYGHCDSRLVNVGDKVVQGQPIAIAGNTGNCSPKPTAANPVAGSHLHFEIRVNGDRTNPELWLPSPLIYK